MGDKHIEYTYYNTLTTKSSPSTFEFHGKLNTPNVVLTTGTRTKQYISRIISINEPTETNFDGELVIEHTPATNYGKKMLLIFPLKTDETINHNVIDKMIHARPGDTLEVNLNTVISTHDSCRYKDDNNIAIFATPILIKTRILKKIEPIIEGFPSCSGSSGAADLAALKARLDAVETHVKKGGPTHGGGIGVRTGGPNSRSVGDGSLTIDSLNDMLAAGALKCDALPSGEEGNNKYVAKLLDVNVDNNKQKLDLTNPIAYSLAFIIMGCVLYFTVTSGYKKLFINLRDNNMNDDESSLKSLHTYEGAVGFILLFLCSLFLIFKIPTAAGIFLCIWLLYTIVLGVSKKSIIVDVVGNSTTTLDGQIKQILRTLPYNMFVFYPFFLFIFGFEKVKQWSS